MDSKNLKRLWALADGEHNRLLVAIVLAVIGVLCGILPYVSAGQIISGLLLGQGTVAFFTLWCGIALAGYVVRTVLYALALATSHKATFSVLKNVRAQILEKLPRLPLGTIIDTHSGTLKNTIVDQVEKMERPLAHLLPEMTANVLAPVAIIIYLFILDWRMALLSLASIPIGLAFMGIVMKDYATDYGQAVVTNTEMNETIIEYVNGIEVIKTFNQGESSYGKFSAKVLANASYFYNWMKRCQLLMSLAKTIAPTTMLTVLPVGWLFYTRGTLDASTLIMCIILSLSIAGPLIAAFNFVDAMAQVGTTVGKIDAILMADEQVHASKEVVMDHVGIDVTDLHFSYNGQDEVVKGVDLQIKEHTMNAFVGPSGGGKSTIAKLIAGYWDVDNGQIKIGGYDLRDIPLEQLYDLVAFVSQDTFLFNETVMDNIRMGNTAASDEEVIAIAKASGCHEFIMGLEDGYQTIVGSSGSHLSGGERQRITIARAMLKDAPIVILDEATSYIDPENEAIMQKAISTLVAGKTLIIIAHRLSTVTDADHIFLIEEGRLVAEGTHETLLASSSLYHDMWLAHTGREEVA